VLLRDEFRYRHVLVSKGRAALVVSQVSFSCRPILGQLSGVIVSEALQQVKRSAVVAVTTVPKGNRAPSLGRSYLIPIHNIMLLSGAARL